MCLGVCDAFEVVMYFVSNFFFKCTAVVTSVLEINNNNSELQKQSFSSFGAVVSV